MPHLVIVIGGDGTILHSVQRMVSQKPILGINWGEVGFLADIEPVEAEKFLRELEPGFPIERRMRLESDAEWRCARECPE